MDVLASSTNSPRRPPPLLAAVALMLVTIIAYWPAIHAGYIWDDDSYITANPLLRDAEGLSRIWVPRETPQYYPLVFTSFWIEYQLWELEPMGYHVTNILLHAANAALLWIVMIRLKVPGAWLIAAVFALHPVMVESVAWISERKNVLSMLFYLCAALAYLRFDRLRFGWGEEERPRASPPVERHETWGWYGAALLLFIGALLSKTVTCSLPAALILVLHWLRVPITGKRLLPLVPMFIIGFALAILTITIERDHVGAVGDDFDFSFIERCLIASKALLFYLWKLIWPHPLMFIYPRWEIDATNLAQYWALIVCLAIGLACLVAFRRGWRGPFVALAFYAGTVFPAIGFFNVYPHIFSFVADHFVYHASIGIIAFTIGGAGWLIKQNRLRYVAIPLLPILFALTWNHAKVFHDGETLYRDNIAKNAEAWMPRNNLASLLLKQAEEAAIDGDEATVQERAREAAEHARAAIDLRPHHHTAHANLSEALRLLDDPDGALAHVNEAIRHMPGFPHYHWQKGRLHHFRDELEAAIDAYAAAVERAPMSIRYRTDLAQLLAQEGRIDEATEHLMELLRLDANNFFALSTLGAIRQQQHRDREAMRLFRRAIESARRMEDQLQVVPRLIRLHLTSADAEVRDVEQAKALANRLIALAGEDDPGAIAVLASVHAEMGDTAGAIEMLERAIEIAERAGMELLLPQLREKYESMQEE